MTCFFEAPIVVGPGGPAKTVIRGPETMGETMHHVFELKALNVNGGGCTTILILDSCLAQSFILCIGQFVVVIGSEF